MNERDVMELMRLLRCDKIRPKNARGWVEGTCPFASKTHSSGTDSNPSFGIRPNTEGPSAFSCMSCGVKGSNLVSLIWQIRARLPAIDCSAASAFVGSSETNRVVSDEKKSEFTFINSKPSSFESDFNLPDIQRDVFDLSGDVEDPKVDAMDDDALNDFYAVQHPYITSRGFDVHTLKSWGIMTDYDQYGDKIVFPIRDCDNRLLAYSRRMTWDKPRCHRCGYSGEGIKWGSSRKPEEPREKGGCPKCNNRWVMPKYLHSKGFKRNYYLYGEHIIDRSIRTGVIVEGNLDPIRLWQAGVVNPVATLGSNPGEGLPNLRLNHPGQQLWRLTKFFDEIVLVADGDLAGHGWVEKFKKFFRGREDKMWIRAVELPDLPPEDPRKKLDPGNMTKEEIVDILGPLGIIRK